MTTPYYQDDHVTIYHGDCREVTEWLTADVLVTDPPYGRNWRQGDTGSRRGWKSDAHPGIAGDDSTCLRDAALRLWAPRPAVCFGDLLITAPAGALQVLAYDKGDSAGFTGAVGGFRRNVEGIYLIGLPSGLGGRSSVLRSAGIEPPNLSKQSGHPHAKPVDLLRLLIGRCPPGAVADPFMGSGSTLRAAKDLGRKAIGIEVDERYCEIAANRMGQEVLDFGGVA
jgi:site-specific DNA-methyltransferase (adenine-specific)